MILHVAMQLEKTQVQQGLDLVTIREDVQLDVREKVIGRWILRQDMVRVTLEISHRGIVGMEQWMQETAPVTMQDGLGDDGADVVFVATVRTEVVGRRLVQSPHVVLLGAHRASEALAFALALASLCAEGVAVAVREVAAHRSAGTSQAAAYTVVRGVIVRQRVDDILVRFHVVCQVDGLAGPVPAAVHPLHEQVEDFRLNVYKRAGVGQGLLHGAVVYHGVQDGGVFPHEPPVDLILLRLPTDDEGEHGLGEDGGKIGQRAGA